MIIMPNNPSLISTPVAEGIVKKAMLKAFDSIEHEEFKQWNPKGVFKPDFATIDEDGEFHLTHIVVSHVDPEIVTDDIAEIASQIFSKKMCKKAVKAFIEEFDGEVCEGDSVYVEVAFLITKGLDFTEHGTVKGCTVYEKVVKAK